MSIGRICSRATHLADLEESAQAAADRMQDQNVGTLVVVDPDRKPIGILTDRDLAVRVVAPALDARTTTVGQVMTSHPQWVREETPIEDAVATMRSLGIRRLPVVDGRERLVGIVSADDVLELLAQELENLGRIAGSSRPGSAMPATGPRPPKRPAASAEGLQRSAADLEC